MLSYCIPFGAAYALALHHVAEQLHKCSILLVRCEPDLDTLESHLIPSIPGFGLLPFAYCLQANPFCGSFHYVLTGNALLNFFLFQPHVEVWEFFFPSFITSVKMKMLCGHTVSVGWGLCRIHTVLARDLLSAGIIGAVRLHSKL